MDRFEPESLLSVGRHPNELGVVRHRKRSTGSGGLQKSQEDHRSRPERMCKGEAFAGLFVPLEF